MQKISNYIFQLTLLLAFFHNAISSTGENSQFKRISSVITPPSVSEGAGARVKRIIGTERLPRLDPFLMLDNFFTKLPSGFPDHPHRGFDTVTYMLKGSFLHEDFKGNRGVINAGDLQWMTAGKGIVHAEMPGSWEEESVGFQLWVNLAGKDKFCEPEYQEIKKEKIPVMAQSDMNVKVIAGESFGITGPIKTKTPALFLDVHLKANQKFDQKIPKGWNALSYVYEGDAHYGFDQKRISSFSAVVFQQDEEDNFIVIETKEKPAKLIIIAGEPINEPVVARGPFVLNSQQELERSFDDYRAQRNGFEGARTWKSNIKNLSKKTGSIHDL